MPNKTGFESNVVVVIRRFDVAEKMAYIQGKLHVGINIKFFFSKTKSLELFCYAKTYSFLGHRVLR